MVGNLINSIYVFFSIIFSSKMYVDYTGEMGDFELLLNRSIKYTDVMG